MHKNKINDKVYIGITCQNENRRWRNGEGYKKNTYFYNSIKKYGWDDGFEHIILFDNLTEEEAKLLEQCYIALYDSNNPNKGYNMTLGGEGTNGYIPTDETIQKLRDVRKGHKLSEETKLKISKSNKGKHSSKGHKHSEETKLKIGKSNKGHRHTEEAKLKISEAKKGNTYTLGYKHTKEAKLKMSKAKSKKVRCIETGKIFDGLKYAAEYIGVSKSSLCYAIKNKTISKGYHWEYV